MMQYLKNIACQKCWVKHLATESRIGLDITYFKWGKVSVPSAIPMRQNWIPIQHKVCYFATNYRKGQTGNTLEKETAKSAHWKMCQNWSSAQTIVSCCEGFFHLDLCQLVDVVTILLRSPLVSLWDMQLCSGWLLFLWAGFIIWNKGFV